MKKINISLLIAAIAFVGFIGCGDSSTTPKPTPTPKFYPKSGSTYTYARSDTDATGKMTPSQRTVTSQTDTMTFQGKNHVILFVEKDGSTIIDSIYLSYESNGDVSRYTGGLVAGLPIPLPGFVIPQWFTLPMTVNTEVEIASQDNLGISFPVGPATVNIKKIVVKAKALSTESVTVGAEKIDCIKSSVTYSVIGDISKVLPLNVDFPSYYSYSAKLGFFAQLQSSYPMVSTLRPPNFFQVLTSYSLK